MQWLGGWADNQGFVVCVIGGRTSGKNQPGTGGRGDSKINLGQIKGEELWAVGGLGPAGGLGLGLALEPALAVTWVDLGACIAGAFGQMVQLLPAAPDVAFDRTHRA